jgi:gamma-D-glutamyl-L-lysine dipeptidyl-peptidase
VSSAAIAHAAIAPLLAEPSLRSEQVTQLVMGETAAIMERSGEWCRARTRIDNYDGWVHQGYILQTDEEAVEAWEGEANGWSFGAVLQLGTQRLRLPLRARVVREDQGVRLPDGRRGPIVEGTIPSREDAIATARAKAPERWAIEHFAGAPYLWGGVTPAGVDCSGLVQTTFAARGISLPRDSAQQAECGMAVPLDAGRPGDLLFFRGDASQRITHVAIVGDADTLVHSSVSNGEMVVEPWLPGTRAAALRRRLVAVRRLEER